jgi:hypothetical protein
VTTNTLGKDKVVDLLYVDIQSADADYGRCAMFNMERPLWHVLIGAYSRVIEGGLRAHCIAKETHITMACRALAPLYDKKPATGIDGLHP